MRFALDSDQQELQDLARRFFQTESSLATVRSVMETAAGHDVAVWAQLGELGLLGLLVSDAHGGAGANLVEAAVLLREAGRALYPGPLLSTTVAAATLGACAEEEATAELLPGIATGATVVTLALSNKAGSDKIEDTGVVADRNDNGWQLNGQKSFVLHGGIADLFLVSATTPTGVALFAVHSPDDGLVVTALPALDPTRPLSELNFSRTPARLLTMDRVALERALQLAAICLAAEQVGGAQAALDSAVHYAKTREQFGRPIGSFQAVKHLLADLFVDVEAASAASDYAAWAAMSAPDEIATVASLAKAFCSDTYVQAAMINLQVHGGIGFTWEADPQLHLKRAMSSKQLLGSPDQHREHLAAHDLDPSPS